MQSLSERSDLTKALGDISSIRQQMARATEFRGYGPLTLALTGVLALLAALAQAVWLPYPEIHPVRYLSIWLATAILSAALIGTEMYERTRRIHSGMADEMIHMAVEQFLPALGAGVWAKQQSVAVSANCSRKLRRLTAAAAAPLRSMIECRSG